MKLKITIFFTIIYGLTINLIAQKNNNLNLTELEYILKNSSSDKFEISLPFENGQEKFVLQERDILSPSLGEKFPALKSFKGYSIKDNTIKISLSYTPKFGINALILSNKNIQLISKINERYVITDNNPSLNLSQLINCESTENRQAHELNNPNYLRKYRIAISSDVFYNKYYHSTGSYHLTFEESLSQTFGILSHINTIYENELSITFELVDNLEPITFLSYENDPFLLSFDFISLNQQLTDQYIGSQNYDIGLAFLGNTTSYASGAVSGANICVSNKKAEGFSGNFFNSPNGYLNFVLRSAHEIGHYMGASHTFTLPNYTLKPSNLEIGTGETLMSYGGSGSTHNTTNRKSSQFHYNSLFEINTLLNSRDCGTRIPIENTAPVIQPLANYHIPKGTAFKLTANATDAENDSLTYTWEQADSYNDSINNNVDPSSTNLEGPMFKGRLSEANPTAYFPPIKQVLNGKLYSTWNNVSDIERDLNFTLTVRDNNNTGGQFSTANSLVTTTADGPFKINNISTNQTFTPGESYTISWDTAGTNQGIINTQFVSIKLTTDLGNSYITLLESTANNGEATIIIPENLTAKRAHFIIEAIDNIYYAASTDIAIGYNITMDCQTFESNPNDHIQINSYFRIPIRISNYNNIIEDVIIHTDITHPNQGNTILWLKKQGLDFNTDYMLLARNCNNNPNFIYHFNEYGNNIFNNCDNPNSTITGLSSFTDLFENMQSEENYSITVFEYNNPEQVQVNNVSIELCSRNANNLKLIELLKTNNFEISPNPNNGIFSIIYKSIASSFKIEVRNLIGQKITEFKIDSSKNHIHKINTSHLQKGIYIITISDNDSIMTKKMIIK